MTSNCSGLRLLVLLLAQALCLGTAYSQQPGASLEAEIKKQEAIYQSRGEKVPEGYVVGRSLISYLGTLPASFRGALADLTPGDRWLDIGAGEGNAVLDYYSDLYDSMHWEGRARRGKKARSVAMSIEDRRTAEWNETAARLEPNQIQYLHGRRLREYSLEELGKFRLITDHLGGFSYTRDLSTFMERVLGLLELNGEFYSVLLDVRPETEPDPSLYKDLLLLTEIERADGSGVKVCSWLKSISCVQVTCETHTEMKRPIELYRVRKVCNAAAVPPMVTVYFQSGTPPPRRFRLGPPRTASYEFPPTVDE